MKGQASGRWSVVSAIKIRIVMDDTPRKSARKIALLSGGDSPEREISLASGDQAERALIEAGYKCIRFDPAETDLQTIDWQSFDACFIALHGGAGEDGRVQSQLEAWRVPYTGSGPSASALAMDKSAAKMRFLECGVPTLPFVSFAADGGSIEVAAELSARLAELAYPLVIKPRCQGSSLGVAVAKSADELRSAIACSPPNLMVNCSLSRSSPVENLPWRSWTARRCR